MVNMNSLHYAFRTIILSLRYMVQQKIIYSEIIKKSHLQMNLMVAFLLAFSSPFSITIFFLLFRTIPIDARFFVTHQKIKVLDVKWHPGSHTDVHLMVLTSDNNLRYCP